MLSRQAMLHYLPATPPDAAEKPLPSQLSRMPSPSGISIACFFASACRRPGGRSGRPMPWPATLIDLAPVSGCPAYQQLQCEHGTWLKLPAGRNHPEGVFRNKSSDISQGILTEDINRWIVSVGQAGLDRFASAANSVRVQRIQTGITDH